jgi:hypothetical protein
MEAVVSIALCTATRVHRAYQLAGLARSGNCSSEEITTGDIEPASTSVLAKCGSD